MCVREQERMWWGGLNFLMEARYPVLLFQLLAILGKGLSFSCCYSGGSSGCIRIPSSLCCCCLCFVC